MRINIDTKKDSARILYLNQNEIKCFKEICKDLQDRYQLDDLSIKAVNLALSKDGFGLLLPLLLIIRYNYRTNDLEMNEMLENYHTIDDITTLYANIIDRVKYWKNKPPHIEKVMRLYHLSRLYNTDPKLGMRSKLERKEFVLYSQVKGIYPFDWPEIDKSIIDYNAIKNDTEDKILTSEFAEDFHSNTEESEKWRKEEEVYKWTYVTYCTKNKDGEYILTAIPNTNLPKMKCKTKDNIIEEQIDENTIKYINLAYPKDNRELSEEEQLELKKLFKKLQEEDSNEC